MKKLNTYINEAFNFRINRDSAKGTLSPTEINNTIYDAFKEDFQWISYNNMWYTIKDANDISISSFNSSIRKKLNDAIKSCIPNNKNIFMHYVWLKKIKNMFYDMLNLLNKNHDNIEFLCDDTETIYTTSMSKYKVIIKVFETDKHVIGIVGPENKSDSNSSNTLIIFAYK